MATSVYNPFNLIYVNDSGSKSISFLSSSVNDVNQIWDTITFADRSVYNGTAYYRSSSNWVVSSTNNSNSDLVVGLVEKPLNKTTSVTGSTVKMVYKGNVSYIEQVNFKGIYIDNPNSKLSVVEGTPYYLETSSIYQVKTGSTEIRNYTNIEPVYSNYIGIANSTNSLIFENDTADVSQSVSILTYIGSVPPFTSPILQSQTVSGSTNVLFTYQISGSNLFYSCSYSASNLPTGLSLNTSTGYISGSFTSLSTKQYTASLFASNIVDTGSSQLYFNVAIPPTVSSAVVSCSINTPFSYQIISSDSPFMYNASNLPPGLFINEKTGLITGSISSIPKVQHIGIGLFSYNYAGFGTGMLDLYVH